MKSLPKGFWIGSEYELEEAVQSPFVTVDQVFAAQGADRYVKQVLAQAGIKKQIQVISESSLVSMAKQKGIKFWVQVQLTLIESVQALVQTAGEPSFVLILDQVQDPQNLGALIRSAHFFGCDAVIMPKDHSAPITEAVSRASSGAVFSIPLVRCTNLVREIQNLKELGLYTISLSPEASEVLSEKDFSKDRIGLVVGSEGAGVRRLVDQSCDFRCSLTAKAGRDSLNASVAGAIAMYELQRQRRP